MNATNCLRCDSEVFLFDKAPLGFEVDDDGRGWATDETGDPVDDFICPARMSSGRWPEGKPHEVTP